MSDYIDFLNGIRDKRMFSRRHYDAIAKTLYHAVRPALGAYNIEYSRICDELCGLFDSDNTNFDPDRFMSACGVESWEAGMTYMPDEVRRHLIADVRDAINSYDVYGEGQ